MALFGGRRRIEVEIVANNRASMVYRQVANDAQSMSSRINRSVNSMNDGLKRYNASMQGLTRATQIATAAAGYAIYRFTKDAIKDFANFERQHGKTMGAMASNYEKTSAAQKRFIDDQQKLKQDAIRLGTIGPTGKGSLYSPRDVSFAQTALIKSGKTAPQVTTSGAVPKIIKFAGGNDIDIETATEYAVNIATQFGIKMEDIGTMLDKITRAADLSTIDVPDIFESLKYAGGIASAMKRPIDEVLSMVAIMGNAGLKGSMAGTGIQAFMTRILNPIGLTDKAMEKAPSQKVADIAEAFVSGATDANGKFRPMTDITGQLDEIYSNLNDLEQAWFSHKLFGLFQMKAGYTLARGGKGGMQSMQDLIGNTSAGTNDMKWDLMLNTAWGKQTAMSNAIMGLQMDIGERLSPITNAIFDEIFNVLTSKGNYKIDTRKLRQKMNEAGDKMAEGYGDNMGKTVSRYGNMGISFLQAGSASTSLMSGIPASIGQMFSGDVLGSVRTFYGSVNEANKKISELPPELQVLAKQIRNVILALTALTAINFTARLTESLSTIWRNTLGRIITANMNVTASTVILKDTGLLNKSGQPIYKETTGTSTGRGPTVVGTGGGRSTGTSPVPGGTILDQHGNPISSPATGASKVKGSSKLGKGVGIASWIYALGEMFGINDTILNKTGAVEGTKTRDVVDTGRTALNWGLMASFADSMIMGGKGKALIGRGLTTAGRGIASFAGPTIASMGAATGISAGTIAAPLALGAGMMADIAMRNRYGNQTNADIAKYGDNWTWNDRTGPLAHWTGERAIIPIKALKSTPMDAYNYGGVPTSEVGKTITQAAPKKTFMDYINPWSDYTDKKRAYDAQQAEAKKRMNEEQNRFVSAKALSATQGKVITWAEYNKDKQTWQNDSRIGKDGSILYQQAFNMTKTEFDKKFGDLNGFVNGALTNLNQTLAQLQQPPPVVNVDVKPNLTVNVKLDQAGNVLSKETIVGDNSISTMLDSMFKISSSRMGR